MNKPKRVDLSKHLYRIDLRNNTVAYREDSRETEEFAKWIQQLWAKRGKVVHGVHRVEKGIVEEKPEKVEEAEAPKKRGPGRPRKSVEDPGLDID